MRQPDSVAQLRLFAVSTVALAVLSLATFGARADTKRIEFIPEKGEMIDSYDFNDGLFVGGSQAKALGASFYGSEKYAAFSCSTNLFVADGTNGVMQLSNTNPDKTGYLLYSGPGLADGDITLLLNVRHHPSDTIKRARKMAIALTDGETTNRLDDVKLLGTNFVRHCILLTNVIDRATLLIWPLDKAQAGRRIQIDDMAFVRGYEPARVVTNTIPGMMMLIR